MVIKPEIDAGEGPGGTIRLGLWPVTAQTVPAFSE